MKRTVITQMGSPCNHFGAVFITKEGVQITVDFAWGAQRAGRAGLFILGGDTEVTRTKAGGIIVDRPIPVQFHVPSLWIPEYGDC